MSRFDDLQTELTTDPLGRGYAGMTDAQAAADLNTVYRTRNRATMTGSEILNAIVKTEYDSLNTTNKGLVWDLLHLVELNPFGVEASLFVDIFGGGSATIAALQAQRIESISRAVELGLGTVKPGYVEKARAI